MEAPGERWRAWLIAAGRLLTRLLGGAIVVVELKERLDGHPVDQSLLLLAAALLGVAEVFRRNGNGRNGGPGRPS